MSGGIMLSKHHWAVTVAGNSVARSAATYWTLKRGRNNERMKVKIHRVNFFLEAKSSKLCQGKSK